MKFKRSILLSVALLTACSIMSIGTGCKSVNPATGVSEFDQAKTEKVKAAIAPLITGPIRRVLAKNPQHAAEISNYIRSVGEVFCLMDSQKKFSPEFLVDQLNKLTAPAIVGINDELILSARDAVIALYKINYADRFNAELPPDQWPAQVANLLCGAIDQALKDSGQPGIKPTAAIPGGLRFA
jgi:hypothetical protein